MINDLVRVMASIGGEVYQDRIDEIDAQEKKAWRDKVRSFRPTIRESFWGTTITWEMRDKPLTEKELDQL